MFFIKERGLTMLISCRMKTEYSGQYSVSCWECGKPIGEINSDELKAILSQPGVLLCFDCEGEAGKGNLPAVEIIGNEQLNIFEPKLQLWISYEKGENYGEMRPTASSILALRLSSSTYLHGLLQKVVRQEGEGSNGEC